MKHTKHIITHGVYRATINNRCQPKSTINIIKKVKPKPKTNITHNLLYLIWFIGCLAVGLVIGKGI